MVSNAFLILKLVMAFVIAQMGQMKVVDIVQWVQIAHNELVEEVVSVMVIDKLMMEYVIVHKEMMN